MQNIVQHCPSFPAVVAICFVRSSKSSTIVWHFLLFERVRTPLQYLLYIYISMCEEKQREVRQRCRGGRTDEIIESNDEVGECAKEQDRRGGDGRKREVVKEGGILKGLDLRPVIRTSTEMTAGSGVKERKDAAPWKSSYKWMRE